MDDQEMKEFYAQYREYVNLPVKPGAQVAGKWRSGVKSYQGIRPDYK